MSCKMLNNIFFIVTVSEDQNIIAWEFDAQNMLVKNQQKISKDFPILKVKFNKLGNIFAVCYVDTKGANIVESYYLDTDLKWISTQENI